jgi:hypothetical protein
MYDCSEEPVSVIALTVHFFQLTSKLTKWAAGSNPNRTEMIKRQPVFLLSLSPWLNSSVGLQGTGTSSYSVSWNR